MSTNIRFFYRAWETSFGSEPDIQQSPSQAILIGRGVQELRQARLKNAARGYA